MSQQTRGEQAARFSLYVPFAVGLLNFLTRGNAHEPGVAIAEAVINVLLILAGFILGVYALFSMRRYGRKGILTRAIAGVTLNAAIVVGSVIFLLPTVKAGHTRTKVVGHWRYHPKALDRAAPMELTLSQDGTFCLSTNGSGTGAVTLSGDWSVNKQLVIGLEVQRSSVAGAMSPVKRMGLGAVQEVDDNRMVLQITGGSESYDRLP